MTECDNCGALIYLSAPFCPYCFTAKKKVTKIESVILQRLEYDGRVAEIRGLADAVKDKRVRYRTAVEKLVTKGELEIFGKSMGYKKGWAWNQWNLKTNSK